MLLATGCEKDTESNEPVELQIAPTVAVTRSVIEGGEQTANKNTIMQNVAVYGRTGTELPGTERAACRTGGCEGHCLSTV